MDDITYFVLGYRTIFMEKEEAKEFCIKKNISLSRVSTILPKKITDRLISETK